MRHRSHHGRRSSIVMFVVIVAALRSSPVLAFSSSGVSRPWELPGAAALVPQKRKRRSTPPWYSSVPMSVRLLWMIAANPSHFVSLDNKQKDSASQRQDRNTTSVGEDSGSAETLPSRRYMSEDEQPIAYPRKQMLVFDIKNTEDLPTVPTRHIPIRAPAHVFCGDTASSSQPKRGGTSVVVFQDEANVRCHDVPSKSISHHCPRDKSGLRTLPSQFRYQGGSDNLYIPPPPPPPPPPLRSQSDSQLQVRPPFPTRKPSVWNVPRSGANGRWHNPISGTRSETQLNAEPNQDLSGLTPLAPPPSEAPPAPPADTVISSLKELIQMTRPLNSLAVVMMHFVGTLLALRSVVRVRDLSSVYREVISSPSMVVVAASLILTSSTAMIVHGFYETKFRRKFNQGEKLRPADMIFPPPMAPPKKSNFKNPPATAPRFGVKNSESSLRPAFTGYEPSAPMEPSAPAAGFGASAPPEAQDKNRINTVVAAGLQVREVLVPSDVIKQFVSYLYAATLLCSSFLPGLPSRLSVTANLIITYFSTQLSMTPWVKNFVCAALIAFSPLTSAVAALAVLPSVTLKVAANPFASLLSRLPLWRLVGVLLLTNMQRQLTADLNDVDDDAEHQVMTVPVVYGSSFASRVALLCAAASSALACAGPGWELARGGASFGPNLVRRTILIGLGCTLQLLRASQVAYGKGEDREVTTQTVNESVVSVILFLGGFI